MGATVRVPPAVLVPVPVRVTVCGLVESPSVMTRLAVSTAATEGVKTTLIVQEAPAAMLVPQVFAVGAKSVLAAAGEPPEMATLVNATAVMLLFVSVTICAAVGVPTSCGPNVRVRGETVNVGWKVSSAMKASDVPLSAVWKAPGFGNTGNVAAVEAVTPVM